MVTSVAGCGLLAFFRTIFFTPGAGATTLGAESPPLCIGVADEDFLPITAVFGRVPKGAIFSTTPAFINPAS